MLPRCIATAPAEEPAKLTPIQQDAIRYLDGLRPELVAVNQDIWTFAELGLQEHRSAARLIGVLKKAGFRVKEGVSGMPTAFVAEYGSGKPIIGILAEYDALPELSQQAAGARARPFPAEPPATAAATAPWAPPPSARPWPSRTVYDKHKLKGTIRLYGTPAEETVIGKVYMTLDGQFNDLDACLHWHPGTKNRVSYMHLQGADLGQVHLHRPAGARLRQSREGPQRPRRRRADERRRQLHARARQGDQPHSLRHHQRRRPAERRAGHGPGLVLTSAPTRTRTSSANFDWLRDIAEGAAKMSRTKVAVQIDTDCHEIIPNLPLSQA